jgi:hypothetical protein
VNHNLYLIQFTPTERRMGKTSFELIPLEGSKHGDPIPIALGYADQHMLRTLLKTINDRGERFVGTFAFQGGPVHVITEPVSVSSCRCGELPAQIKS